MTTQVQAFHCMNLVIYLIVLQ